jgi:drug/metabolite transporter superfamily protein YnfA
MANKHIYPVNGIISATVASNNLTVALKNYDNTDFSGTTPLIHKIGSSPRALQAALSVTVNAGVNTFNAGGTELTNKEVDYFVYLGWRAASSAMFILISRIPWATTYADFSATATNEKYGAYSGSAPASTDVVVNIGRFNATNSGTASYNWSIPAIAVVKNEPTFETRWLTFVPDADNSWTCSGSLTYTSVTVTHAKYKILNNICKIKVRATGTLGGSASNIIFCLKPFEAALLADTPAVGAGFTAGVYGGVYITAATGLLSFIKYDNSNYATTGANVINMLGDYEI